jgi:hypothetical protein
MRDEEQDVDSLQCKRFDGEEIAGEGAGSLLAQERTPRLLGALGHRRDACANQHLAHGGR